MLDKIIIKNIKKPLDIMASVLLRFHIHANHVTFFALIPAMIGFYAITQGIWWLATIMILFNRLCDGLDGALARLTKTSDFGAYSDIVLDFIFYAAIPLAFALHNPHDNAIAAMILMFSFVSTGSSFLAYAIFAEKRNINMNDANYKKGFHYIGGLTEGSETILIFLLFCLFPTYFSIFAYIFAILCALTTISRIVIAYQHLRD